MIINAGGNALHIREQGGWRNNRFTGYLLTSPPTIPIIKVTINQMSNYNEIGTYRLRDKKGKFSPFKRGVKMFFKRLFILSLVSASIYGIYVLGGILNPKVHIVEAEVKQEIPAVLQRIAGCESQGSRKAKGTHHDKNGQVLMRSNTNKSVDVGKYQVNTVWFSKATELGLDITKEKDNETMALWIYQNRGTEDWSASKKCWQ